MILFLYDFFRPLTFRIASDKKKFLLLLLKIVHIHGELCALPQKLNRQLLKDIGMKWYDGMEVM